VKILALNGSHRGEAGCTQWLLNKMAEGAIDAGAEFEIVTLANHEIVPCTGCEICHTPEHYLKCVFAETDEVEAIHAKMRAADIYIFATPVYVFTLSGLMKIFLDRLNSTLGSSELCVTKSGLFFGKVDPNFHSKPFVVLTCCGNVENETVKNVVAYYKTFARFFDAPIVGVLTRKSIGVMGIGNGQEKGEQKPVITEVSNAYIQAGRELALQGRITQGTQKKANQDILSIPFSCILMRFRFLKEMVVRRIRGNKQ